MHVTFNRLETVPNLNSNKTQIYYFIVLSTDNEDKI
jgi:hypothetical protein